MVKINLFTGLKAIQKDNIHIVGKSSGVVFQYFKSEFGSLPHTPDGDIIYSSGETQGVDLFGPIRRRILKQEVVVIKENSPARDFFRTEYPRVSEDGAHNIYVPDCLEHQKIKTR